MSHFQPVQPVIPWAMIGTMGGLVVSAAVFLWWVYAYAMYWLNKPRRSRYEEEEDEEEEEEEPRRQPRRRARSRRRPLYEEEEDDY